MKRARLFTLAWGSGLVFGLSLQSLAEDSIGKDGVIEHWTSSAVTAPVAALAIVAASLLTLALRHHARLEDLGRRT